MYCPKDPRTQLGPKTLLFEALHLDVLEAEVASFQLMA